MDRRLELHQKLVDILGSSNVYFQPPETVKLKFPCFIYSVNGLSPKYADNRTFKLDKSYTVTYVSTSSTSDIPEKVSWEFEKCRHTRRFVADNLYHDSFTIYY